MHLKRLFHFTIWSNLLTTFVICMGLLSPTTYGATNLPEENVILSTLNDNQKSEKYSETHPANGIISAEMTHALNEILSESFNNVIANLAHIDAELKVKIKEVKKREDACYQKEHEIEEQRTAFQKEKEQNEKTIIDKTMQIKNEADRLKKLESEIKDKTDQLSKKEKRINETATGVKIKEKSVKKLEEQLNQKEAELTQKTQAVRTEEERIKNQQLELNRKETQIGNQTLEVVKQKNQKEEEIQKLKDAVENLKKNNNDVDRLAKSTAIDLKILIKNDKRVIVPKIDDVCSLTKYHPHLTIIKGKINEMKLELEKSYDLLLEKVEKLSE